jgi:hypothetical protein
MWSIGGPSVSTGLLVIAGITPTAGITEYVAERHDQQVKKPFQKGDCPLAFSGDSPLFEMVSKERRAGDDQEILKSGSSLPSAAKHLQTGTERTW